MQNFSLSEHSIAIQTAHQLNTMHTRQRKASSTSDCRPTAPPYLQAAFCGRRPVLRLVISRDTPSALQSLLHTASSAPNDPARPRCCHQQPLCLALRRSDLSASCQPFFYKVRVEIVRSSAAASAEACRRR